VKQNLVALNFSKGADNYDKTVRIQKILTKELACAMKAALLTKGLILDIGCGTGALIDALKVTCPEKYNWRKQIIGVDIAKGMISTANRKYPDSSLVQGDMHHLPFSKSAFDSVVSSSAFQWARPLEKVLDEMLRVLKPGGSFYAAFFIDGTLHELYDSYSRATGDDKPLFPYASLYSAKKWFQRHENITGVASKRTLTEIYSSVSNLLRSLRSIGANNSERARNNLCFSPRKFSKLNDYYRSNYKAGHGIRATYETIIMRGEKRNIQPDRLFIKIPPATKKQSS